MEHRDSIFSCEKSGLSEVDKLFLQHSLQFYIACEMFKPPYSTEKITDAIHEFICYNHFNIIQPFQGTKNEEFQENLGKKTSELLQTLSKHVDIDIENMQLESKKAEEASNALFNSVMGEIVA